MDILDSQAFTELVVLLWNIKNRRNQAARVVTSRRHDNRIHGHEWKKPTCTTIKDALWRRVICSKYGTLPQSWRLKLSNTQSMCIVWRGMVNNLKDGDVANWIVVWKRASKGVLQAIRLYGLVKSKGVVVAELELTLDNKFVNIRWDNIMSRMLMERKLNMLVESVGVLKDFVVISEVEDRIIWIHHRAGVFSVKKLSQLIVNAAEDNLEFNSDRIWKCCGGVMRTESGVVRAIFAGPLPSFGLDYSEIADVVRLVTYGLQVAALPG
ncbi:hypothetical protein V6N13_014296 [Hibiscus sabdariffa]